MPRGALVWFTRQIYGKANWRARGNTHLISHSNLSCSFMCSFTSIETEPKITMDVLTKIIWINYWTYGRFEEFPLVHCLGCQIMVTWLGWQVINSQLNKATQRLQHVMLTTLNHAFGKRGFEWIQDGILFTCNSLSSLVMFFFFKIYQCIYIYYTMGTHNLHFLEL